MYDSLVPTHRQTERAQILDITFDYLKPRIGSVLLYVPMSPRCQVVVEGDTFHPGFGEEAVGEMTSDEPRTSYEEPPAGDHLALAILIASTPISSTATGAGGGSRASATRRRIAPPCAE